MPLIKPRAHRVKVVRHICRLHEPNRIALLEYARFIGDTPDYVLNQLIDTALARDREFVTWRADQPATPPVKVDGRRRRAAQPHVSLTETS